MTFELLLLRHAKSVWPVGVSDIHRPLSKRGIKNAAQLGEWLRKRGIEPDLALVSPARRTKQTIDLVIDAADLHIDPVVDHRLYAASWWDVLDVVRQAPSSAHRLLVVGHNPSLEDLAIQLAGLESDDDSLNTLRTKFPTCALAVLSSDQEWSDWGSGQAQLNDLRTPRRSR
ncbi:MAG: histidine phosphatase family protein [Actinobacteria bacterium]|nr:histidine phosphatase family protein [Actinomycetota bacterium]